jgi:hypothetical protein
MKKKNHTKRRITRKKMRKTKRKNGGSDIFENIFGVIKHDKNTKENFYETKITVNGKEHKINYFTPNNYLVFKSTDQLITPTFSLYLDKYTPTNITIKIGEYVINSIVIIRNEWYAIIRSFEQIKKLNLDSFYYKIKSGVFSNKNEKLYIDKTKYTKEKNSIVLKESEYNKLEYNKLEESKNTAFLILRNFYIQQEAGEVGKEVAVGYVGDKIVEKISDPPPQEEEVVDFLNVHEDDL